MWLRNNWGLWKGSRLSKWFNEKGIQAPDDMSGIILDSFWRHLNGKPLKLDEQIKYYQDYWKMIEAEEKVPKSWLALVDAGKYGESWDAAAEHLKNTVARDAFAKSLNAARKPLGKVKSRELRSTQPLINPSGALVGEHVEIEFWTVFENKRAAIEKVTLMLDKDKKWRVSGYTQPADRLPDGPRPIAPIPGVDPPTLQGPFHFLPNEPSVPRPPIQGPQPIPDEPTPTRG
jgi:hypothetical protein